MYCKKCGRKLDDDMRFCDRCGQSVRQGQQTGKEARKREIKELKEERLNRKQKLQEKDNKKKRKKNSSNKKNTKVLAVIFMLLLLILIAFITYRAIVKESENAAWRTSDGSVAINATEEPTQSPAPTNEAGVVITPAPTSTAYAITTEINADGYREFKCTGGAVLPYPASFIQQNTSGNVRLNAYDQTGGGAVTLTEKGPVSGAARELMSEYAKEQSGNVKYSRAGEGWYVVETEEDGVVRHRKCLVINNIAVYYDFSYSNTSNLAEQYSKYITYMDEHFSL